MNVAATFWPAPARNEQRVKSWVVTTSHGVLVGLLLRDDAERAVG
jgi:hypothetical protein